MEKTKIEETLEHQEHILSSIDRALEEQLLSASWEVDDFKGKILGGLRWGLFLRPTIDEPAELRTTTKFSRDGFHDDAPLIRINFEEILALEKNFSLWGLKEAPIFSPKINKELLKGEILVDFNYETLDADVSVIDSAPKGFEPLHLLDIYELRLTLPDIYEAFGLKEDDYLPKWQHDSLDAYEKWKWSVEQNKHEPYVQIGGHGRWIQGSYTDTYIAQVNNDVGDAGAVFIKVSSYPMEKFSAWVDMH